MARHDDNILIGLTPEVLLKAYACGIFPMAEDADDPALFWIDPPARGIIPLDAFHVPARLARTGRTTDLRVVCDRDFAAVVDGCAEPARKRARTWINAPIRRLYSGLFEIGHCHTVEVYDRDALVGGLYGVSLGAAFFGESMFHRVRDASKIALVHLVARLSLGGFALLDTHFQTDHLATFGATEVPQELYGKLLASAIRQSADMSVFRRALSGAEAVALARG